MKIEFSRQIFGKSSNIKFHENSSNGDRFILCEHTDVMKLIFALRNFGNEPRKKCVDVSYVRKTISNTDLINHLYILSAILQECF